MTMVCLVQRGAESGPKEKKNRKGKRFPEILIMLYVL